MLKEHDEQSVLVGVINDAKPISLGLSELQARDVRRIVHEELAAHGHCTAPGLHRAGCPFRVRCKVIDAVVDVWREMNASAVESVAAEIEKRCKTDGINLAAITPEYSTEVRQMVKNVMTYERPLFRIS